MASGFPVAFYSRKLAGSQRNWSTREKETYAIVASLRKWAGTIGFQPVVILTDHRSLEDWVTENVDPLSGPRGRKARWHETLSQFDLEINIFRAKKTVSRGPYQDGHTLRVRPGRRKLPWKRRSARGSEKMSEKELADHKMVAVFRPEPDLETIQTLWLCGGRL